MKDSTKYIASVIGGICAGEKFRGIYLDKSSEVSMNVLGKIGGNIIVPAIGFVTGFEGIMTTCNYIQSFQKAWNEKFDATYADNVKEDSQK